MSTPPELFRAVDPAWSEARVEARLAALKEAQRRRRRLRAAAAVGLAAAAVFGVLRYMPSSSAEPVAERAAPAPREAEEAPVPVAEAPPEAEGEADLALSLADGSRLLPANDATDLSVERMETHKVEVLLRAGTATFDVARNEERTFVVRAGDVVVRVLGTRFEVTRTEDGAAVSVERGRVRVQWPGGTRVLAAGEHGRFAPSERAPRPVPWRRLARDGRHEEAFDALPSAPLRGVADLLLAADAARFSGHTDEALGFLRAASSRYPEDPRAPLAAFTEGRVLLSARRLSQAARAFRLAQDLEPSGPLFEDALAREVECLLRSGASGGRARAQMYLERFPRGRRRPRIEGLLASP